MAGKTNSKQICVIKTQKTLLEFMDDTRYEREPMAWPFTPTSRIRLHAKDYSEGTGDRAIDAFYNLSFDEFIKLQMSVQKMRGSLSSDYNRVKRHLDRLITLKQGGSAPATQSGSMHAVADIANQFASSSNEIFSEAGAKLKIALAEAVAAPTSNAPIDQMIKELTAELDEITKSKEIYSEMKILNYDQYANPENPEERRITTIKVVYKPKMNNPYVFTVANGWGLPHITKLKGVVIKEGSTRLVDTVNVCMDENNLLILLKRVEMFLQAMTNYALQGYFEAVTNPVLSYEMNHSDN